MLEIRLTTPDDLPELRRVAIETQMDTFGAFNSKENMDAYIQMAYHPKSLAKELNEPGSMNYLARDESELTGFMRLRRNNEAELWLGKSTIELQRLYVRTIHHGKGIGAALMHVAVDHAVAEKIEWMWLGVWEGNIKAQQFYAKWGFERFSEHVFQMGDDPQTDWLLRRRM
ncbi:MAG: GNAT family N-acetyltransferase [Cytophagales bacterium]|nr:GNAT family N-acetyltransferase [Cytophagales bacterium]